jgi:hypothetical protein
MNHVVKFPDLFDYIEAAQYGTTDCPDNYRQSALNEDSEHWDFGVGYDGAYDVARNGWPEGRTKIEDLSYKFRSAVKAAHRDSFEQPVFTRSLAGSGVNVGRFNAGLPDAMVIRKRIEMDSPVIDIVCNVSMSAAIGAEVYMIRGAAIAALADLLELSGRRVRITAVNCTKTGDSSFECHTTIKKPGDPLQMDAIAFALAHPAYMRRLGFSIMEQAPLKVRKAIGIGDGGHGYGAPSDIESTADLYMPKIYGGSDWSEDRANKWVEQQLVNMGVLPNKEEA